MTTLTFILDGLIILLLAVAIGFAVKLNARLRRLSESRSDLEQAVVGLDGSISKAETGLTAIQATAEGVSRDLDERVQPARTLVEELGFIVERAESSADRLERAISQSRTAIAGEEQREKEEAERFARILRPINDDDKFGPRPAEAEEPRSRGAALVRALRGMR